jgi:hypothetical protein
MVKARLAAVAALSVLALQASVAHCEAPMDAKHFCSAFIAALKKADPKAEIRIKSDLELEVGKSGWIYLGNAYARYREDPASLQAIVDQFVQVLQVSHSELAVERDKVIVLVRARTYVDEAAQRRAAAGRSVDEMNLPMHREMAGDLMALIALDEPKGYAFPPQEQVLKAFGGDREAVWKLAAANTRAHLGKITVEPLAPGVSALTAQDAGATSAMLWDAEVWSRPEIEALGAHPVILVGKSVILVVDGADVQVLEKLKAFAALHEADPDWVSPQLFVRNGGTWSVLPR